MRVMMQLNFTTLTRRKEHDLEVLDNHSINMSQTLSPIYSSKIKENGTICFVLFFLIHSTIYTIQRSDIIGEMTGYCSTTYGTYMCYVKNSIVYYILSFFIFHIC